MATKLGDLADFLTPGLTLTVLGKEYTLPLPSAKLALWCRTALTVGEQLSKVTSDAEFAAVAEKAAAQIKELPDLPDETPLHEQMLGDAYAQMVADGVPDPYIQVCIEAAYFWIVAGEEAAARFWTSGGHPEAMGPGNRAQRRAAAKTGGRTAAKAATTLTPDSTSGTTSPQTSSGSSRSRRGRRSRGRSS